MANPSIIEEPFKEIKAFDSKWNASNLPIQYTIENDKFPVKDGIYPPDVTNYYTEVDIYVNGSLVGTIKQIPDSNNQTKVNIQKYVKSVLKYEPTPSVYVDDNAWCEFYIEGTENYVDSGGTPQSNPIDNSGEVFYASLSSLQFGNERGGNMYDYIIDTDKTDLAKWMTTFERGQLVDFTNYSFSILSNGFAFNIVANKYDINGNLIDTDTDIIIDEGNGLYRLNLNFVSFDSSISYIEVLAQDYTNTDLSEPLFIDVDLACVESPDAPINLVVTQMTSCDVDLEWTSTSGGNELGFEIERSEDNINYTAIGTTSTGETTFSDSNLTSSATYYYRVRALGGIPSSYTPSESVFIDPAFDPSTEIIFTVDYDGADNEISWSYSTFNSPTTIERDTNEDFSSPIVLATGQTGEMYIDVGLTDFYYYRIRKDDWICYSQVVATDIDVGNFYSADSNITDATERLAYLNFVYELKQANIYDIHHVIYPLLGTTAGTQKWNAVDPRDLDAAYRITFNGSWTHSATGAKPDGNAGTFANTHILFDGDVVGAPDQRSNSIGMYSRDNITEDSVDYGVTDSSIASIIWQRLRYGTANQVWYNGSSVSTGATGSQQANTSGYFISNMSRNGGSPVPAGSFKCYRNNTQTGLERTGAITRRTYTEKFYFGARNINGSDTLNSSREHGILIIADYLDDTQRTDQYNAVVNFMTALGRNVP